jgi:hypothetical protein
LCPIIGDGDQSGILLVVAVLPIDPLVPFVKIKLAAFPAFVQRAGEVAAILVGLNLFQECAELSRDTLGMFP